MRADQRDFLWENDLHSAGRNGELQNRQPAMNTREQPQRSGPFTFTAGWLGSAFDRSRIDKREAEQRRSRNM